MSLAHLYVIDCDYELLMFNYLLVYRVSTSMLATRRTVTLRSASRTWFLASAAKYLGSVPFWVISQCRMHIICLFWSDSPAQAMASSFTRFLDHTQRRTTVGRTPLDEWSARRRDLYLTKYNIHNKQPRPPGRIRTHSLSRLAAAEVRLRPRGYWARQGKSLLTWRLTVPVRRLC